MSRILIIGAGGHAKVVADILMCQGINIQGFFDDDPKTWGTSCLALPVLGPLLTCLDHSPTGLVMGIGDNYVRQAVVERLGAEVQHLWHSAIHPRAVVASSARLGQGVVVAAGAVINPDSVIGEHVIINTGATVDHDCKIGNFSHIAPGAHLTGGVSIGRGTLIGAGATITPYRAIGNWVVVGAGSIVVHDIPDRVIVKGVPAQQETPET